MRHGIATFGLDYGRCPPWLFERMVRLARSIAILMVLITLGRKFFWK